MNDAVSIFNVSAFTTKYENINKNDEKDSVDYAVLCKASGGWKVVQRVVEVICMKDLSHLPKRSNRCLGLTARITLLTSFTQK